MANRKDKQWTLAGAARSARDARIATVRFLASPAMAQWHLVSLMAAYGYHKHHRGDHDQALGQLYGGMGYRPPFPKWKDGSNLILADEARYLAEADLYVLSPQMCGVVTAAALTLSVEDLSLIAPDDLPTPTGVVVLPHPLICRAINGELADIRAFTWRHPAEFLQLVVGNYQRALPAVRVSVYNDAHGPIQPESFVEFASQAAAAGTPIAPLILDAIRCWPYQQAITEDLAEGLERYASGSRQLGQLAHAKTADLGLNEDQVTGEYKPGDEIDDHDDLFAVRFLYAFWRLCEQRIAVTETSLPNHSAQVLAARAGVAADVRVAQLRRTERKRPEAETGTVNWQHRWPVRMHKVRQWYPSKGSHQILYRGPYVKGPENKPMISGDTAWGLIR